MRLKCEHAPPCCIVIYQVRKNEMWLRREVEELERETAPGAALKPGRSSLKVKTEKLEKTKALRQAHQVRNRQ